MKVGEVIESRTGDFLAESDSIHEAPALGSLVWVRDGDTRIYAVVGSAATGSREPGRSAVALGQSEEDLPKTYPHLSKLLRTTFAGQVVGHETVEHSSTPSTSVGGMMPADKMPHTEVWGAPHYYLPPRPVRLHGFVYLAQADEVRRFTASLDFLPMLASGEHDEALCACLRLAARAHPDPSAFLLAAGKELVPLLCGDVARLNSVLRRLRP